jgi:F-type H+-transporting ATPase subunit b
VKILKWLRKMLPLAVVALLLAGGSPLVYAQGESKAQPRTEQQGAVDQGSVDANDVYRHSPMVRKMGHMMGLSTETAATVFEVLNFAVLALALGWVLVKTLPRTFRDRTTSIQKNLVDARTATEEANARLSSVEDRLAKLDAQIAEMHTQAEKDAAAEEARMRAAVEEEKQRILGAAEQEIASASLLAQRQLQKYAAELAIEQAGRRLVVSAETDRLLVQDFARRLTGNDKGGQN